MLNKLSVKLSLLFVGIALVSVGVIALWVNRSVQTEFTCYCQRVTRYKPHPVPPPL